MGVIRKYYKRAIEPILKKSFENYKVVSLLGARQVGKTTVVNYLYPEIDNISLKTDFVISSARTNPDSFISGISIPAFIDEIQNVPELFGSIQEYTDKNNFYSQFIISGSNKLSIDEKIKESLSGRAAILEIGGLSMREIEEINFNKHFIPTKEYIDERKKYLKEYRDIWDYIHRGFYPELYDNPNKDWEEFYSSYVQTYIEKDVLRNIKIKDLVAFTRFLVAVSARTGEILDYTNIANDVGVSSITIKEWISLLVKTNIIYLLQPYFNSHLNRAIKSPKIYFRDTGLAAYLSGWLTKEQLEKGAKAGAFFETFVVNELIKSFINEGKDFSKRIFFYNGKDKIKRKIKENGEEIEETLQCEIDFIIEENNVLYPIEIKKKDSPNVYDATAFNVLDKDITKRRGMGVIISSNKNKVQLKDDLICLPIEYI